MPQGNAVVESKPFWRSKTFWFNGLALLAVIVDWFAMQDFAFVTEEWFVSFVGLVNIGLRFFTVRPTTATVQPREVQVKRAV